MHFVFKFNGGEGRGQDGMVPEQFTLWKAGIFQVAHVHFAPRCLSFVNSRCGTLYAPF